MGHIRDLWKTTNPATGKKIKGPRWGKGKRWQARHVMPDGSEKTRTFTTEQEAKTWLSIISTNPAQLAPNILFGPYAEHWLQQQIHYRPRTLETVRIKLNTMILPTFATTRLRQIDRNTIQAWINQLTQSYAPSTIRVAYAHLTSILSQAVLDGLLVVTPAKGIKLPAKVKERVVPLTDEQVANLAEWVSQEYFPMVVFQAATGVRPSEMTGLTWDRVGESSVLIDRQLVAIRDGLPVFGPPKSAAGVREISIGPSVTNLLNSLDRGDGGPPGVRHFDDPLNSLDRGDSGLVFRTRTGAPVSRTNLSGVWRNARAAGVVTGAGWHQLRHYHASRLIASGLSVVAVSARLGHASTSETLETYAHLWPSEDARMGAVSDMIGEVLTAKNGTPQPPCLRVD